MTLVDNFPDFGDCRGQTFWINAPCIPDLNQRPRDNHSRGQNIEALGHGIEQTVTANNSEMWSLRKK